MLKKTINYVDYNGVERSEDFYFNLNQAEMVEMETGISGGYTEWVERVVKAKDGPTIMKLFKAYILKDSSNKDSFSPSQKALNKGILVDIKCPNDIIDLACKTWGKDGFLLNQTFHKSFVYKSHMELLSY